MELNGSDDLNLFNWASFIFKMIIFRSVYQDINGMTWGSYKWLKLHGFHWGHINPEISEAMVPY